VNLERELVLSPNLTAEEDKKFQTQGWQLTNKFAIFLRTHRVYDSANDNYLRQLQLIQDLTNDLLAEHTEVSLQAQSGYLFFCNVRLRTERRGNDNGQYLLDLFEHLGISGFAMELGCSRQDIVRFTDTLWDLSDQTGVDYEGMRDALYDAQISRIEVLPPIVEDLAELDERFRKRQFAQRTFFNAIGNLEVVMHAISSSTPVSLSRTTRVIHSIVDQVLSDESYLLELTALRDFDEYTFVHSTNVCVYSICLGANLGLSKAELATLGFAALFHDVGKTKLPLQVLNKPSDFTENEWELMRKHPTYGMLSIAKSMPFDDVSCRAMLVAFEHHANLDGSGYPSLEFKRKINLYSKIVAICDVFDALTSGRVYRRKPRSPEYVLKSMLEEVGKKFDKTLIHTFVRTLSFYPPGTLLLLTGNKLGLVIAPNSTDHMRPRVKIIGDKNGLYEVATELELDERDASSGNYKYQVVRTIDPSETNIDLARYVLESWRN
jgi:HD-GYP domain-containing protein (c-di-GMP phosphodiesterase class II)